LGFLATSFRGGQRRGSLLLGRFKVVFSDEEVGEEEHQEDRVDEEGVGESLRIVTFDEQELRGVRNHDHKLNQLSCCHILLPEQVLLVFRAERGQEVVKVHENMNERVEQANKRVEAAWREFHTKPHMKWHCTMMENV